MTARWKLDPMREEDLDEVLAIEKDSFSAPWPREAFASDLNHEESPHARSYVLRDAGGSGSGICGYLCFWMIEGDLDIHNVAVRRSERRQGAGRIMVAMALEEAAREGCRRAFLEVRPSNQAAIELYKAFGFEPVGRRKSYYEDTGEDAIVMRALVPETGRSSPPGAGLVS